MERKDKGIIIYFTKYDVYESFEFEIYEETIDEKQYLVCEMEDSSFKYENKRITDIKNAIKKLDFGRLEELQISIGLYECVVEFYNDNFSYESGNDNVFVAIMNVFSEYLNDKVYVERAKQIIDMEM